MAAELKKLDSGKEFGDMCIRLDTIPKCGGQSNGSAITILPSTCIGMLTRDKYKQIHKAGNTSNAKEVQGN